MNTNQTKRINTGHYVTATGYEIVKVVDWDNAGIGGGWNLIAPDGEWCNTFATKADAVAAAQEIAEGE